MTYVITSLCLRDASCMTVCPVECIVPGKPQEQWPWYYIDPETCIDCGACVPECPYNAIFPEDEVPTALKTKGGELLAEKVGTPGYTNVFDGSDHFKKAVHVTSTRVTKPGEVLDLTYCTDVNAEYFKNGPGYEALK